MRRASAKRPAIIAAALLMLGVVASSSILAARAAEALPYLFEQLKTPSYKASLATILRGQKKLPPWIGVFLRTKNGVASPGTSVTVEGAAFELYSVCEPHNCGGNFLYVLYARGGSHAWALVTKNGEVFAVLGNPSPAQRRALMAAMQQ